MVWVSTVECLFGSEAVRVEGLGFQTLHACEHTCT